MNGNTAEGTFGESSSSIMMYHESPNPKLVCDHTEKTTPAHRKKKPSIGRFLLEAWNLHHLKTS